MIERRTPRIRRGSNPCHVRFDGTKSSAEFQPNGTVSAQARMLEYFDKPSLDLLRQNFPEIPRAARAAILFEEENADLDRWHDRLYAARALVDVIMKVQRLAMDLAGDLAELDINPLLAKPRGAVALDALAVPL